MLAPDAVDKTWDLFLDGYGADVPRIDRALAAVFNNYSIDPSRVLIEGFSDGATYAVSLGLPNGDLFSHIVSFSGGGADVDNPMVGRPKVSFSYYLFVCSLRSGV